MKRAVILHGTDANPEANWFPWLKKQLEAEGYEVWAPLLPDNHVPNHETYNNFLFKSGWDFTDNVVVGHSSGAVSVLNLLMDKRCPRIRLGVVVSAWEQGTPATMEEYQFAHLFPAQGFDFARIKAQADTLAFLHGDDDIYCPLEQAQHLAQELGAPLTTVPGGGHLGNASQELPQVWDILQKAGVVHGV